MPEPGVIEIPDPAVSTPPNVTDEPFNVTVAVEEPPKDTLKGGPIKFICAVGLYICVPLWNTPREDDPPPPPVFASVFQ